MNDSDFNAKANVGEEVLETRYLDNSDTIAAHFRRTASAYCPKCEKPVELLSYERSAELFKTDKQDIEFLAKQTLIHRVHNRKGTVLICSNSLFDCFDGRSTRLLDSHFEIEIEKSFEARLAK